MTFYYTYTGYPKHATESRGGSGLRVEVGVACDCKRCGHAAYDSEQRVWACNVMQGDIGNCGGEGCVMVGCYTRTTSVGLQRDAR
ncbi:hypothetical protein SDJN03_15804, partial [Cucurbita argyrosperma subsp. sororia]